MRNFYKRYKEYIQIGLFLLIFTLISISFIFLYNKKMHNSINQNTTNVTEQNNNIINNSNTNNTENNSDKNVSEIKTYIEKEKEKLKAELDKNYKEGTKSIKFKTFEEMMAWDKTCNLITKNDEAKIKEFINNYLKDTAKNNYGSILKYYFNPYDIVDKMDFITSGNPHDEYFISNINIIPKEITHDNDGVHYYQKFDVSFNLKLRRLSEPFDYEVKYEGYIVVIKYYGEYYIDNLKLKPNYDTLKPVQR